VSIQCNTCALCQQPSSLTNITPGQSGCHKSYLANNKMPQITPGQSRCHKSHVANNEMPQIIPGQSGRRQMHCDRIRHPLDHHHMVGTFLETCCQFQGPIHDASKTTAITFFVKCYVSELKCIMQDCPVIIFETDVTIHYPSRTPLQQLASKKSKVN